MTKKPSILVFNRFYLPGFRAGGPIRSLANMVDRLGSDFDFYVVTQDRDAGQNCRYSEISDSSWAEVGAAQVRYVAPEDVSIRQLAGIVGEVAPSVIYLNSFFDDLFTARILLARRTGCFAGIPTVLAPRGEFSPGALGLKPVKKSAYLRCVRLFGLHRGITWQASSEREKAEILSGFRSLAAEQVVVAPNLARDEQRTSMSVAGESEGNRPCRVCFLSRISPKKNLDFALRVLARVKTPLVFTIYGPQEVASYWVTCQKIIDSLPAHIQVAYQGEVPASSVRDALAGHDLFFLPTRGENYGHVIYEALDAGLPVLLSDQTPWKDLEANHVGWALPLDSIQPFVDVIDEVGNWDVSKRVEVSKLASEYAREKACDPLVLEQNRRLFLDLIEPAPT